MAWVCGRGGWGGTAGVALVENGGSDDGGEGEEHDVHRDNDGNGIELHCLVEVGDLKTAVVTSTTSMSQKTGSAADLLKAGADDVFEEERGDGDSGAHGGAAGDVGERQE